MMRSRSRPGLNRRYFHTNPRIDKRDMNVVKKKIEALHQKKIKKELEKEMK